MKSSIILALILSNDDLLSIEQIESFIFPHTHLYIVTLSSQIQRTNLLGNISLSYNLNRKSFRKLFVYLTYRYRNTIPIVSYCQTIR
jgi:hypothetical protein